MSQGTITAAQRDTSEEGTWSNDYGTFHVWRVTIDVDGEATESTVNRKVKDGSSKDPNGETTELKDGRWKVVAQSSNGGGGGGRTKDFKADPIKLRGENARSALHAAKDLVVADKIPLGELPDNARRFYSFIEEKAKVDG